MGANPHYVTSKVQETNDDLSLTTPAHFSQTDILSCRTSRALSKGFKITYELFSVWMQWPLIKKSVASTLEKHFYAKIRCFLPYFLALGTTRGKKRGGGVRDPHEKRLSISWYIEIFVLFQLSDLHDMSCSIKCHMKSSHVATV